MSKFNLRGKLTVTVHGARGLSNKELVGKMDPYAVVTLSGSKDEKFKTKVAQDQHQNPVWEQSYLFNLEGKEEIFHLNIWNEATMGDDHIGRCDLSLDTMDFSGNPAWYSIKDKTNFTKQTGEVKVSLSFEGSGLPAGSLAFTTHEKRKIPTGSPAPATTPVVATVAPPVVQQQQQTPAPAYGNPPQQQQQQPMSPAYGNPSAQQFQSQQPNYQQPPQQQAYQSHPPQQQQFQQQPVYSPPQQTMYQQAPAPVYQQPMQPIAQPVVYQSQPQVVYQQQPQPVYQAPAAVVFQQAPAVVYNSNGYPGQQQPQQHGQLIGYWPNGQPRYA